ncbi:hypothetical protein P170DRAFT_370517 [Aspergillus steynii IBT 23096]|uniref:SUN domain-containing protein n=1 Tax=Aspergillus steynii IBT 23096 TaxID=1392250 RepID=A0A2I2FR94_9EURO|nr:uncharacterized protein P170DRAFT_370517 [Aspergillus steynii IBT 23096]PLB43158.1 hypothetical protein P170DRAFT_370517 [Aspergillus steynii IBT 23096]
MSVAPWSTSVVTVAALASSWFQGVVGENTPPICLTRDWREAEAGFIQWPVCVESRWQRTLELDAHTATEGPTKDEASSVTISETPASTPTERQDHELDTDSLLDNANFLSFEDWKKQNLAKAGQSADVGGSRRAGAAGKEDRRRPTGINNALDSLGDDAEIELDFGGFGADTPEAARPTPWEPTVRKTDDDDARVKADQERADSLAHGISRAGASRRKDAGTTCKERFNYASFDCAATVLKTNPECKGSSSVLIENKDSYMLNECRANNKFLILELCDDILVDTVVLANYEFFSSIFHTFRVSVSDRYPAKPDQWRELGIYEARNTREVQAFAVENPLIWARYLKIEFLTHYGHEFYCPLSLIRVHGTTMMEEYKHDGEGGRADDDVSEESLEPSPPQQDAKTEESAGSFTQGVSTPPADEPDPVLSGDVTCSNPAGEVEIPLLPAPWSITSTCRAQGTSTESAESDGEVTATYQNPLRTSEAPVTRTEAPVPPVTPSDVSTAEVIGEPKSTASAESTMVPSPASSPPPPSPDPAAQNATAESVPRATGTMTKEEPNSASESVRPAAIQPPSPNPTTQESFFKSVNKRLQMLESNSTLSLLYIEEQSRILRDAFSKVEKRQLGKTSTFLENLNVTVLNELKQFREQYDHVWKSVALEFEHQRIQYHQEIYSISTQLGVLADELVFQKRVSVIQSIMVLFCFALVLFSRGAVSSYMEFPSVQNMVSRSYSLRSSSPVFGSPSMSPSSTRPTSSHRGPGHRRNLSDDSQDGPLSPTAVYAPPTPPSEPSSPETEEGEANRATVDAVDAEVAPPFRSHSSPPVLTADEELADDASVESGESVADAMDG